MRTAVVSAKHIIDDIDESRVISFVRSCACTPADYALFPGGDVSPYARCFAVFNYYLLQANDELFQKQGLIVDAIYRDLEQACLEATAANALKEKPYLQLLTFSLSALHILAAIDTGRLKKLLPPLSAQDIRNELEKAGAFEGRARSGNTAMFYAILLLFREAWLDDPTEGAIGVWIKTHLDSMNRFGFWGPDKYYTYLHFQNGYHQYEILEYLKLGSDRTVDAAHLVASLQDPDGHFAPSPGGGGCYDYDAIFMLTPEGRALPQYEPVLYRAAEAVRNTWNEDGGFCESRMVRPWKFGKILSHISSARSLPIARQRARISFALARRRYDTVPTHWSRRHRRWGQSNLWDTWFRMMTLARIDHALHIKPCRSWGFIDFPGIGYHPSLYRSGGRYH